MLGRMLLTGALAAPGEHRIRTLEDHFAVTLPPAYRHFLSRHNGARVVGDMLVLDFRDSPHHPPVGRWDHEASDDFLPVVRPVFADFDALTRRITGTS